MSVLSDMQTDLAVDAHLEVMGDTVVRVPRTGATEEVQAIWNEGTATRDITAGERGVRFGDLQVPVSQEIARDDKWTILGEENWVPAKHEWLGMISGGFRMVHLERDEKKTTRKPASGLV